MTGASTPLGANPPLVHPGPAAQARREVVPTAGAEFEIFIEPGERVGEAIRTGFAQEGYASGCAEIVELDCDILRYVIPAPPEDATRLAWYSAPREPEGISRIEQAWISVGRDGAEAFLHCHGIWRLSDGGRALGHLLAEESVAAASCRVRATGFRDAIFDRRHDAETGFQLFAAAQAGREVPAVFKAVAVTLRPNEDIVTAVEEICRDLGIRAARGPSASAASTARNSATEAGWTPQSPSS